MKLRRFLIIRTFFFFQQAQNEDDEWLEHKEPEVDLTGLKVSELVLPDDDELEQDGKDSDNGGAEGPWKKKQANSAPGAGDAINNATPAAEEDKEKSSESTKAPEPTIAEGGEADKSAPAPAAEGPKKYIPPSLRRAQEAAAAGGVSSRTEASEPKAAGGGGSAYVPPGRRGVTSTGPTPSATTGKLKPEMIIIPLPFVLTFQY